MALDLYIDGFAFCTQTPQPQDFAPVPPDGGGKIRGARLQ